MWIQREEVFFAADRTNMTTTLVRIRGCLLHDPGFSPASRVPALSRWLRNDIINNIMATTPTKQSSKINDIDGRIHTLGYHLAKKLLGERQTNECIIRLAYEQQQHYAAKDDHHHQSGDGESTTSNFPCFRANWRSNVRFPWHLTPTTTDRLDDDIVDSSAPTNTHLDDHDGNDGNNTNKKSCRSCAEALFVDVTFDFIFYPREVVDESRTESCYILQYTDLKHGLPSDVDRQNALDDYFALSVAVRIGAMVATRSSNAGKTTTKESIIDGYEYNYIRGTNVLTMSDLDEHCKSIDIVLEEMDPCDVARIVGDAFLEGCSSSSSSSCSDSFWQVMTTKQDSSTSLTAEERRCESFEELVSKCIVSNESKQQWYLKLHHKSLQADGLLPLSSNGEIISIGQNMLDMILLQSNHGGVYTSIPTNEALLLWKVVDPSIVKATEKHVEPSPRKLSPARSSNMTAVSHEVAAGDNSPMQQQQQQQQQHQPQNHQKKSKSHVVQGSGKASTGPQETALFARGKSTTLGGSRKKPKFTFGPKK